MDFIEMHFNRYKEINKYKHSIFLKDIQYNLLSEKVQRGSWKERRKNKIMKGKNGAIFKIIIYYLTMP